MTPPFGAGSLEEEWNFLLVCASPVRDTSSERGRAVGRLNWNALLTLAAGHGVLGLLATFLRDSPFEGVPAQARARLQDRVRAQQLFNLAQTAELFRILNDFSSEGIETVLIKGPVISLLAYGGPAVRSYADLDLLVPHRAILNASRRMTALGFTSRVPDSAIVAGRIPGEFRFTHKASGQIAELHTERTLRYYPRPLPLEDLLIRKRYLTLDGRPVPALSLEDELVLNCVHGATHLWERLIWIADVAALVTRYPEIDWQKVRQATKSYGATRMLHVALQLGATLLSAKLPPEMAEEIKRDLLAAELCRQVARWLPQAGYAPPPLFERALFRIRMCENSWSGAAYLLRLSFSPTEEDWREGAGGHRSGLRDSLRRPFRLLRKYGSDG